MSSSVNISLEDGEESRWTDYLEDFSLNREKADQNIIGSCNSSLISDAAWNGLNGNINSVKRLNFKISSKKNSNRVKYSRDDDLEDTASSPVNSPKVSTLKQMMEINHKRTPTNHDVTFGDFLSKQDSGSNRLDAKTDDKNNNIPDVELKKRGLCLVPISAFINNFGSV